MKILIALLILFFVDSIILFALTKYKKLSKESTLYKRLNLFLVIIPLIVLVISLLYFSTDTYIDWFITSVTFLIIWSIGMAYENRVKKDRYISSIMGVSTMVSIFILFNIIIIFTLSSMKMFLYFMLLSTWSRSIHSKKKSKRLTATVTITFIILMVSVFLVENHMNIKSKPLRVADKYVEEKGYDLDEIDYRNMDSSFRGERINMGYIINGENGAIDTILSLEYFEGEIIHFDVR